MTSIIYKPRSGVEVMKASPKGTEMFLYSDLCSRPGSAYDILCSLPRNSIILLQNPDKMNSGHWVSLSFHPETKEVYFFSSYGGMPDREKNKWLSMEGRRRSGQVRNLLNDGLKQFAKRGWQIHYNDYPYQIEGDSTATCGIWATAFMNSGLNPDEFEERHKSVFDYYRQFF